MSCLLFSFLANVEATYYLSYNVNESTVIAESYDRYDCYNRYDRYDSYDSYDRYDRYILYFGYVRYTCANLAKLCQPSHTVLC